MAGDAQECPSRKRPVGEIRCVVAIDARLGEGGGRPASERSIRIGRSIEYRNRAFREKALPPSPPWQLRQVVGTDEPDEAAFGPCREPFEGIGRVAGAKAVLDVARLDAGVALQEGASTREALVEACHADFRLQGVLWRDEPPYLVEAEPLQRLSTDVEVALMRRIEGAAKQADATDRTRRGGNRGQSDTKARARPERPSNAGGQRPGVGPTVHVGRVWPCPRTTYL